MQKKQQGSVWKTNPAVGDYTWSHYMAISSKKFTAANKKRNFYVCQEANVEIRNYLEGCYESDESDFELTPYWQLSQYEADLIASDRSTAIENGYTLWFPEELGDLIERLKRQGKSAAARYIAARIYSGSNPNLKSLTKDWVIRKSILASVAKEELTEVGVTIFNLQDIGIRFGWQARRFIDLYKLVRNPRRVWNSCYQVNKKSVLEVATTPNFNKLPHWVKKDLVLYAPQINIDRIGNIWRLPDCVKAWKYQPSLPKKIAEKVGRMSPRSRVIAAIAWKNAPMIWSWHDNYGKESRHENEMSFWKTFREISRKTLLELLPDMRAMYSIEKTIAITETWLKLPHGLLRDRYESRTSCSNNLHDNEQILVLTNLILNYASPEVACLECLGCKGKATVKLFQNANLSQVKWAIALGNKSPDKIQKILATAQIEWEPDAVDFLVSLPEKSQLKLLATTTFKYRGQVHAVTKDHIRDTGYLWSNLDQKPDMGRVRCWFSAHETLSKEFVKNLPDETLEIHPEWEQFDGLCAVDGTWELEFPQSVATLKYWGKTLQNCVGGYGPAIKQQRSVVFVVKENGLITHCVEMNPTRRIVDCQQFYKSCNRNPDPRIEREVLKAIALS